MGIITSLAQGGEDVKENTNPEHPIIKGTPGESFQHEKWEGRGDITEPEDRFTEPEARMKAQHGNPHDAKEPELCKHRFLGHPREKVFHEKWKGGGR